MPSGGSGTPPAPRMRPRHEAGLDQGPRTSSSPTSAAIRFYGLVAEPVATNEVLKRRVLTVSSLTGRPIPTRFLSANQVIAHWRRAAGSRD